jgi:hypothetical protein
MAFAHLLTYYTAGRAEKVRVQATSLAGTADPVSSGICLSPTLSAAGKS